MQKFSVSTRLLLGAGIAAAVCWTAADMLLVGFVQPPQPETLFAPALAAGLGDDADMAALMLTASPQRLLWGVLPATFSGLRALAAGTRGVLFCRRGGAGLAAKHGRRRAAALVVPTIHTDAGNPLALFRGAARLGLAAVRGADPARANRAAAKKCRLQSTAGRDFHCVRLRTLPPRRMGGHDGRRHAESGATGVFRIGVSRCRQ